MILRVNKGNSTELSADDATSNEIDLIELIEIIWDGKWLITAITAAFAIIFVGIAFQIQLNRSPY